ncbi:ubiquinol oxidase subunit II, partial [Rhizobium leguminosarum]
RSAGSLRAGAPVAGTVAAGAERTDGNNMQHEMPGMDMQHEGHSMPGMSNGADPAPAQLNNKN